MAPPRAREVEGFDRTVGRSNRTVGGFDRAVERCDRMVAGFSRVAHWPDRSVGWLNHAVERGGDAVERSRRLAGGGQPDEAGV